MAKTTAVLNKISRITLSNIAAYDLKVLSHEEGVESVVTVDGPGSDNLQTIVLGDTLFITGDSILRTLHGSISVGYSSDDSSSIISINGNSASVTKITVILPPNVPIFITAPNQSMRTQTPMSPKQWVSYAKNVRIPELQRKAIEDARDIRERAEEKRQRYLEKAESKDQKALEKKEKARLKGLKGKVLDQRSALHDAQTAEHEARQYRAQAQSEYERYLAKAEAVGPKVADKIARLRARIEEVEQNN